MHRVMSATEARVHFGDVLRRVKEEGETVFVERGGRPQAVVIGVAEYERLVSEQAAEGWRRRVREARELIRAEVGERMLPAPEDVVRAGRKERDEEVL